MQSIKMIKLNTVSLALYLFSGIVGYILSYAGITNKFMLSNIAIGSIALIISIYAKINSGMGFRLSKKSFFFFSLIFITYLYSMFVTSSTYTVVYFVYFVLYPFIITSSPIITELLLRILTYFSIVLLPFSTIIFESNNSWIAQADMGLMYVIFNIVLAGILHFLYYRKSAPKHIWIFYLSIAYLLFNQIIHAPRGIIVCLGTVLTIAFLNRYRNDEEWTEDRLKKRLRIVFIVAFLIVVFLNLKAIIVGLYSISNTVMADVPVFIEKLYAYVQVSDISNGRNDILGGAFKIIANYPLGLLGIGNFGKYYNIFTGGTAYYPHNFILQLWVEVGILPAIIAVIITIKYIKRIVNDQIREKDSGVAVIFIFSLLFPRFLISLNIWDYSEIWIALFFCLNGFVDNKLIIDNVSNGEIR